MTDRTTIQIKSAQKEQLDELKRVDGEAYHSVLAMLIANYNNQDSETIDDYSQDIERIINRIDDLENSIPRKTAEELR